MAQMLAKQALGCGFNLQYHKRTINKTQLSKHKLKDKIIKNFKTTAKDH
jgi:hypothetical protein